MSVVVESAAPTRYADRAAPGRARVVRRRYPRLALAPGQHKKAVADEVEVETRPSARPSQTCGARQPGVADGM